MVDPPREVCPSHSEAAVPSDPLRPLDWPGALAIFPIMYITHLQSRGVAGWVTSYGADLLGTAWCWWLFRRTIFSRMRHGAQLTVAVLLVAGVTWEWSQRYDFSGTLLESAAGTFDPVDIAAYAITLATCYALEAILRRRAAEARVGH